MRATILPAVLAVLTGLGAPHAMAAAGFCGQPQSAGSSPKTADALAALKAAVGTSSSCDADPCVCDVNGNGDVTTSDALRILQSAVGQTVVFACDCECATAGGAALTDVVDTAGLSGLASAQIQLEVKIVGIDSDSFDDLGLDFNLSADVKTDLGPKPGGTNGDGRHLVVDSDLTGGPAGLQYLLYDVHPAAGALPIVNKNFTSPFTAVKTVFLMPTDRCVLFDASGISEAQNFTGDTPVENLDAVDAGYDGDEILYDIRSAVNAAGLLASIQADNRNDVLSTLNVFAHPEQAILHMVDDIEPTLPQIVPEFRTRIQAVTMMPFGNFTGVVLDVAPRIIGTDIELDLRPGTEVLTFFYSTAFLADGVPSDAEIPIHRRSRNVATIQVPSGQTLVLGGLLRNGETVPEKGLPLLGDVPLVGSLFTHKRLDPQTQNLLIFVTPTIVNDD